MMYFVMQPALTWALDYATLNDAVYAAQAGSAALALAAFCAWAIGKFAFS